MKPRNTCLSASALHAFGILSLTAIMMDFALHTQLASAGEAARQQGNTRGRFALNICLSSKYPPSSLQLIRVRPELGRNEPVKPHPDCERPVMTVFTPLSN
jgi:hypothetical protein